MALTPAQLPVLKAAILAETDPAFVGYRTNGQTPLMTAWLNADKSPAVKAWRVSVPPQDSDEATPWPAFDALSAGKRESWRQFFAYARDYSKASIRKWITDVWGNATAASNAEAIMLGAGLRNITRAESYLGGVVTATTNNVTSIKLAWEGPLTDADISAALAD